ncbi:YceI family protein [Spongiibacter sp. KMU-158]|uniref:YceI family protein n=1 Tax=Spongiibacter pelagi TaxID=2760804 RepID=A0A927GVQ2_9GAMM|nr:YceI family protein [Spongiibacter pelagi]MBD2858318.1 YceI family protein [Spongiibacter pelagi]
MKLNSWVKSAAFAVLFAGLSQMASAMDLQAESSQLNFVTVKNDRIAEAMSFRTLWGSFDEKSGEAEIHIDLASVDSGIEIRDSRMKEFLFETAKFKEAVYTAKVDVALLKKMKNGQQNTLTLDGTLDLHGETAQVSFEVVVTRLRDGSLQVATLKPGFVSAMNFALETGIGILKDIAKLGCIDLVVPVTFNVTFK